MISVSKLLFIIINISMFYGLLNGDSSEYSLEEIKALKRFRELVDPIIKEEYMRSDVYLIKWIRSKRLDLELAEKALQKNIDWRNERDIKNLPKKNLSKLSSYLPYAIAGYSKDWRPMFENYFGRWDIRKFAISGQRKEFQEYADQMYERLAQKIHESTNATEFISIVDLKGYNLRQHACLSCLPMLTELTRTYEPHYPHYTSNIIIVNTPSIFQSLLTLLKPLMSPELQNGIQTYGYDRDEYLPEIFKFIDPGQVTKTFGGTFGKQKS